MKRLEITDNLIFVDTESVNVQFDDGVDVPVGFLFEINDTTEFDDKANESYPYIVSIGAMACNPDKAYDETDDKKPTQQTLIYDCNSYMGVIPVAHILVNNTGGGLDEVASQFTCAECTVITTKPSHGTCAAQGITEFKHLQFSSDDACMRFIEFICTKRLCIMDFFIGFTLDKPINLIGDSGWSLLAKQIKKG